MNNQKSNSLPSVLGLQARDEIIPINLRYIGKEFLIFSIPPNNAKVPYSVIAHISTDSNIEIIHTLFNSLIIPFSKEEKRRILTADITKKELQYQEPQKNIENIVPIEVENKKRKYVSKKQETNKYPKPSISREPFFPTDKAYQQPANKFKENRPVHHSFNQTVFLDPQTLSKMSKIDKMKSAEELYIRGLQIFKPNIYNSEVIDNALKMLDQAQRLTLEIYPGHFTMIVLPGRCLRDIRKLDPEAYLMNPNQFTRFIIRRKILAQMRSENIITGRIKGIRYATKSEWAKRRQRNSLGFFA